MLCVCVCVCGREGGEGEGEMGDIHLVISCLFILQCYKFTNIG